MSRSKIRNMRNMWRKAGYRVEDVGYSSERASSTRHMSIISMELEFWRIDKDPVSLDDEWVAIRGLANRQNMYVLPLDEKKSDGSAKVQLVSKHLLDIPIKNTFELEERLYSNYWLMQGLERVETIQNQARELNVKFEKLRKRLVSRRSEDVLNLSSESVSQMFEDCKISYARLSNEVEFCPEVSNEPFDRRSIGYYRR